MVSHTKAGKKELGERFTRMHKAVFAILATLATVATMACSSQEQTPATAEPSSPTIAENVQPSSTETTNVESQQVETPDSKANMENAAGTDETKPMDQTEPTADAMELTAQHVKPMGQPAKTVKMPEMTDAAPAMEKPSTEPKPTLYSVQPEHPATMPIIAGMSPDDQKCLPEQAKTLNDLTAITRNPSDPAAAETFQCLSSEGQFQLFIATQQPDPTTSEASLRCLWEGLAPLHTMEVSDGNTLEIFGAMLFGSIAVAAYCTDEQQMEQIAAQEPEAHAQLLYMQCMIDTTGGPAQFMNRLLEDPDAIAILEADANEQCEVPEVLSQTSN